MVELFINHAVSYFKQKACMGFVMTLFFSHGGGSLHQISGCKLNRLALG